MGNQKSDRKRLRHTGRRTDHTFLRLPHYVITSEQWRALSGPAVKFVVELASAYNGRNNGDLSLTRRQALQRGWNSAGTRDRAASEASDAGFVVVTRHGGRNACTLYAITWEAIDDVGKGVIYPPSRTPMRLWERRQFARPENGATVAPMEGRSS